MHQHGKKTTTMTPLEKIMTTWTSARRGSTKDQLADDNENNEEANHDSCNEEAAGRETPQANELPATTREQGVQPRGGAADPITRSEDGRCYVKDSTRGALEEAMDQGATKWPNTGDGASKGQQRTKNPGRPSRRGGAATMTEKMLTAGSTSRTAQD